MAPSNPRNLLLASERALKLADHIGKRIERDGRKLRRQLYRSLACLARIELADPDFLIERSRAFNGLEGYLEDLHGPLARRVGERRLLELYAAIRGKRVGLHDYVASGFVINFSPPPRAIQYSPPPEGKPLDLAAALRTQAGFLRGFVLAGRPLGDWYHEELELLKDRSEKLAATFGFQTRVADALLERTRPGQRVAEAIGDEEGQRIVEQARRQIAGGNGQKELGE